MKNSRVFSTSEGRYRRPWTTRIPVASELEEFRRTSCLLWLRILMLAGRDLRTLALNRRQQLLRDSLGTSDLVQLSETFQIPAPTYDRRGPKSMVSLRNDYSTRLLRRLAGDDDFHIPHNLQVSICIRGADHSVDALARGMCLRSASYVARRFRTPKERLLSDPYR